MSTDTIHNETVIFLAGRPHSGKTTVRKLLCEYLELRGGSCSDVIYYNLASMRQTSVEELRKLPKEQLRPELISVGDSCTAQNPTFLVDALFAEGYRVIDGIRRKRELDAVKEKYPNGLFVWVSRPGGPEVADNTELGEKDFQTTLLNAKTLSDLPWTVKAFVHRFNLHKKFS